MTDSVDVLVIGGGVIGLTTAYFLARESGPGAGVDKGDLGREASWAGAGIIPPGNPEKARTPLDLLRARSAEMYPELARRLREETGIDNGYLRCGGLELAEPGEEAPVEAWREEGLIFQAMQGD